ncbi:MAG: hypothetical protein AB1500_01630 [Bacillota bacterium]
MKRPLGRCLACFTLGVLAGAVAMALLLGHDVERLTYRLLTQQEELDEATRELEKLKVSLEEARQKRYVQGFDIKITLEGRLTAIEEEGIQIELKKEIERRLNPLMDRELSTVNFWLIPGMINDRIAVVGGRQFELHIETVVVDEILGVAVRAVLKESSAKPVTLYVY